MAKGGYFLRLCGEDTAEWAYDEVAHVVQNRADELSLFTPGRAFGGWGTELKRNGDVISVDEWTPIDPSEYRLRDTPHGDSLFQRICLTVAFLRPDMPFYGKSINYTDGREMGIPEGQDIDVHHAFVVEYDGRQLTFRTGLTLKLPDGDDKTSHIQRWERTDEGSMVRSSWVVHFYSPCYETLPLSKLLAQHPGNPLVRHEGYLRRLADAVAHGEVGCAGTIPTGQAYGITLTEELVKPSQIMLCLNDRKGHEIMVDGNPFLYGKPCAMPAWVSVSPDGELLVWQTRDTTYLWDGIWVRRITLFA